MTVTASQNWEKNLAAFTVPDPTTTPASIGRIIRGQQASDGTRAYYSSMGDFYQLSTNETGAGNSGGPSGFPRTPARRRTTCVRTPAVSGR